MFRHTQSTKLLTIILLPITWTILVNASVIPQQQSENNDTDTTTASSRVVTVSNVNGRLSNSQALQWLLAAFLTDQSQAANASTTSAPSRATLTLQPALLDYENETAIEDLEKVVVNNTETATDFELPPDVYEVPLDVWINDENSAPAPSTERTDDGSIDQAQQIILDALRTDNSAPTEHTIRHRGRRLASRNSNRNNRRVSEEPVVSLPLENLDINGNILNLLRRPLQESGESDGSLAILKTQERFNMTVDYQAPFQNIESTKLMEIVILMRSDCSQIPRQKKVVRWVSGMRGILFECRNGAWVVTYLSRRKGRQRPNAITDCNEVHLQGVDLVNPEAPHQLVIHYSNGERKTKEVLCKHDDRHTNHQLIDNHINADPDHPVLPVRQSMAGAWTVIQRRESGRTKFYRSMKRYKRGFGSVESGEYWLGLETMHEITHARDYMLRVEVTSGDNNTYFSEYDRFRIGSEAKSYRLRLGSFIEPANGTLSSGDFLTLHHGGKFHTRDSDRFAVNCARLYGTAFWFRGCWAAVNLNGPYITSDPTNTGVRWATANPNEVRRVWKTEMMIKPIL